MLDNGRLGDLRADAVPLDRLPRPVRALASYLLFESPYARALMALGEADTLARQVAVRDFFGWRKPAAVLPAAVGSDLQKFTVATDNVAVTERVE